MLAGCAVEGGGDGYGGPDYGVDYYEPYGVEYGGWGPDYRVAPFRGGDHRPGGEGAPDLRMLTKPRPLPARCRLFLQVRVPAAHDPVAAHDHGEVRFDHDMITGRFDRGRIKIEPFSDHCADAVRPVPDTPAALRMNSGTRHTYIEAYAPAQQFRLLRSLGSYIKREPHRGGPTMTKVGQKLSPAGSRGSSDWPSWPVW